MRYRAFILLLVLSNLQCLAQNVKLSSKDEKRLVEAKALLLTDKNKANLLLSELSVKYPENCRVLSRLSVSEEDPNKLSVIIEKLETTLLVSETDQPQECYDQLGSIFTNNNQQYKLEALINKRPELAHLKIEKPSSNSNSASPIVNPNSSKKLTGNVTHITTSSREEYKTVLNRGKSEISRFQPDQNGESKTTFIGQNIQYAYPNVKGDKMILVGCGNNGCRLYTSQKTTDWSEPKIVSGTDEFEWIGSAIWTSESNIAFVALKNGSATFEDIYEGTVNSANELTKSKRAKYSTPNRDIAISSYDGKLMISSDYQNEDFDLFAVSNNQLNRLGSDINTSSNEIFLGSISRTQLYVSRKSENKYSTFTYDLLAPQEEAPMITIIDSSIDQSVLFVEARNPGTNEVLWKNEVNGSIQFDYANAQGLTLLLKKDNHLFQSLTLDDSHIGSSIGITLEPIKKNSKLIIDNVEFAKNSYELTKSSLPTIDQLVEFLKEQESISIEISGHTDDVGRASYNKRLSEQRAESVAKMVISKGINKSRIKFKGYGSEQPLVKNDSDKNRAKNRRVEMKVL